MFIVGENQKRQISKTIKELLKFKPFRGKYKLIQTFNCKDIISISKIKLNPLKRKAFPLTKKYLGKTTRKLDSRTTHKV